MLEFGFMGLIFTMVTTLNSLLIFLFNGLRIEIVHISFLNCVFWLELAGLLLLVVIHLFSCLC